MLPTIVGEAQQYRLVELVKSCLELPGEFWECGVYLGGTASIIQKLIGNRTLRLFDTFGPGMPEAGPNDDGNPVGKFELTSKEYRRIVKYFKPYHTVKLHKGIIPDTFVGLENSEICFAHLDVDNELTYLNCLEFIWPRMVSGGAIALDDYGLIDCIGATIAINNYTKDNNIEILKVPGYYGAWIRKS